VRCHHCRIFFITHPRSAKRKVLRCPFGCREAHRKQESTRRSVAYYQEEPGKRKKRELNRKRCRVAAVAGPSEPEACVATEERQALRIGEHSSGSQSAKPDHDESPAEVPFDLGEAGVEAGQRPKAGHRWSEPLIEFVRVVSGLIEGRRVSRQEAEQLLGEVLRQHSMAHWRRVDHFIAYLHQNPP
jgi:hypothetical protein